VRREIVALIVLSLVTAVGFALTRSAASAVHALRLRDAAAWYTAGERQLARGQSDAAVGTLRRAAAIDHDNRRYQLALATALATDRQDAAATQVLMRLRELTPEDPDVSVQLARLAARNQDFDEAVRHYENAVYGMWTADQGDARRALRIELIRYLLDHQQRARALSELLILSGNLPDDPGAQAEAGRLYFEAGEPQRALEHYQRALRANAKNEGILAAAGEAAFAAHDYRAAQRYLHSVASLSDDAARIRDTTDFVLAHDPLRPGLSLRERRSRARLNLGRALQVLDECHSTSSADGGVESRDRDSLRAEGVMLEHQLSGGAMDDSTASLEQAVDVVYRIEQMVIDECGGSSLDRALLLIGRRYEANQQ
jgi:tetratricopeptide (TPR) repeat protein